MLDIKVPEIDSQDQHIHLQGACFSFEFPPKNFFDMKFKLYEQARSWLERACFEMGQYRKRHAMFLYFKQTDNYFAWKCKYCKAFIKMSYDKQQKRVKFLKYYSFHKHNRKDHDPHFYQILDLSYTIPFIDFVDRIEDLVGMDHMIAFDLKNRYYRTYFKYEQILLKHKLQSDVQFTTRADQNQILQGLVFVTPSMQQNYIKYGSQQALCYEVIPFVTQIFPCKDTPKCWIQYIFTGLDSNNRVLLFGCAMIRHDQKQFYKCPKINQWIIQSFIDMNKGFYPHSLICSGYWYIKQAFLNISKDKKYDWNFLVNWSFVEKSLNKRLNERHYPILQRKKVLKLYLQLLKETKWNVFEQKVFQIAKLSPQKLTLYEFLSQMQDYCYISFDPHKFCGFTMRIVDKHEYNTIFYGFRKTKSLYGHIKQVMRLQQQRVTWSNTPKVKKRMDKITSDVKRFLDTTMRKLGIVQDIKNLGQFVRKEHFLQQSIAVRILQNFNLQRNHKAALFNKFCLNSDKFYIIQKNFKWEHQFCRAIWDKQKNKWKCACLYQQRFGLPCNHLLKILHSQSDHEIKAYFHTRWLKNTQSLRKTLKTIDRSNRMTKKVRRHA